MLRSLLPRSQLVSNIVSHQHVTPSVVMPRASSCLNRSTTTTSHPLLVAATVADRVRTTTFMATHSRSFHTTRRRCTCSTHHARVGPSRLPGHPERRNVRLAYPRQQSRMEARDDPKKGKGKSIDPDLQQTILKANIDPDGNDRSITLHFKKPNGEIETVQANEGDDIVDVSWEYDLDIEGTFETASTERDNLLMIFSYTALLRTLIAESLANRNRYSGPRLDSAACEKSVACSTCHVILEDDVYDKLEEPSDDENDMLDLAFGLTDTSRLGCQIKVTKDFDGTTITLPSATRNLRVDGSKPTPH